MCYENVYFLKEKETNKIRNKDIESSIKENIAQREFSKMPSL